MKRILAILMVMVLMMTALTACGGDKGGDNDKGNDKGGNTTAAAGNNEGGNEGGNQGGGDKVDLYTLVKNATEKTLAAKSYDAKVKLVMDGDIMGQKSKIEGDLAVKMNDGKISIAGAATSTAFGQTESNEVEYFFDGSYAYMSMYGEGYKMACTAEEFSKEYGSATEQIVVLPQSLFAGLSGDGSNVVVTMDEATCESLFGDDVIELCYDIVGNDLNQVTTKDAKVTLSVKGDYLASYKVEFTCEMGLTDKAVYVYSQETTFVSVGAAVTVTGPNGYENFYLMDEY